LDLFGTLLMIYLRTLPKRFWLAEGPVFC